MMLTVNATRDARRRTKRRWCLFVFSDAIEGQVRGCDRLAIDRESGWVGKSVSESEGVSERPQESSYSCVSFSLV